MIILKLCLKLCILIQFLLLINVNNISARPQQNEPAFELPVELIGFPVIVLSVRLANFVRKLGYSLSPKTYVSRTRREIASESHEDVVMDIVRVEKKLIAEFGKDVCLYEKVCIENAIKARKQHEEKRNGYTEAEWKDIFSNYKSSPTKNRDFYLLSVFFGDIIGSPELCKSLAKRRPC